MHGRALGDTPINGSDERVAVRERKADTFDGEKWITCGGCGKRYSFEDRCRAPVCEDELARWNEEQDAKTSVNVDLQSH